MNVLMISPGYPADMPEYARGLAETGARVIGLGDQPVGSLPEMAKQALADYVQVESLWQGQGVIETLRRELSGQPSRPSPVT